MTLSRQACAAVLVAVLVLASCGGDDRAVAWRDLDVRMPDGWSVVNEQPGALYVADGAPGEEAGDPGNLEVGVQFLTMVGASSDDWRRLVEERGWELERDEDITVDDLPATLLEFSSDGRDGSPPTREQVVVVPSRDLEILSQAVTVAGQEDGPEVFDANAEDFTAIRESIEFGAPDDFAG